MEYLNQKKKYWNNLKLVQNKLKIHLLYKIILWLLIPVKECGQGLLGQ